MRLEDLVVTKFDVDSDELVPNLPYILEKADTGQRQIAVLRSCEPDALSFGTWTRGITITLANAKLYKIYKADLSGDGMNVIFKDDPFNITVSREISEEKLNEIKDAANNPPSDALDLSQSYGGYAQAQVNIICRRMIDYRTGKTEGTTLGIENFYDVKSDVTIIRQFLYKVTRVIDNFRDQIEYEVCLPTSEKDKMYYMDRGWRIHPMFYNAENGCYMPSVIIHRPVQIMDSPDYDKDKSITLQILTGLQMLHLIEHGLFEKDKEEPGMYAGIDYTNHSIVISNAYTEENNRLVIDDEETVILKGISGYISRFLYWNNKFDWLFFPKETTKNLNRSISDSEFVGPSISLNNIIKWGSIDSDNFGMFNYWMSSTAVSEKDYIIPWEFGGY